MKWRPAAAAVMTVVVAAVAYTLRPNLPPPRINGYTQLTHDGLPKSFGGQAIAIVLTDGSRIYVQENLNGQVHCGAGFCNRGRFGSDAVALSQCLVGQHLS